MDPRWWKPEEDRILKNNYGSVPPAQVQKLLRDAGFERSTGGVKHRAWRLGLEVGSNSHEYTTAEAAQLLGIPASTLYHIVKGGRIKTTGRGKYRRIPHSSFEELRKMFPPLPERHITVKEFCRRTGYQQSQAYLLFNSEAVKAVRRGLRWYVDEEATSTLVEKLRISGATRLSWAHLSSMDNYREVRRAQGKQRRSALKET